MYIHVCHMHRWDQRTTLRSWLLLPLYTLSLKLKWADLQRKDFHPLSCPTNPPLCFKQEWTCHIKQWSRLQRLLENLLSFPLENSRTADRAFPERLPEASRDLGSVSPSAVTAKLLGMSSHGRACTADSTSSTVYHRITQLLVVSFVGLQST